MQNGAGSSDDQEKLNEQYQAPIGGPTDELAFPRMGQPIPNPAGKLNGETTQALRKWMHSKGIEREDSDGTPEDHIGAILMLMVWISKEHASLLYKYLKYHLLTWAPHYLIASGKLA
jgi:TorA maturation chaperone TorD